VAPDIHVGDVRTALDFVVDGVAYIALAILAFLMLANVVITWARLTRHRHFAGRVVEYLEPFALLFRVGNPRREGLVNQTND
jgi:hypothetical protein